MALFGQQLLTVQYYCNDCRTPFEKVKDAGTLQDFREDRQELDDRMPDWKGSK
jgi:hypothetical protein